MDWITVGMDLSSHWAALLNLKWEVEGLAFMKNLNICLCYVMLFVMLCLKRKQWTQISFLLYFFQCWSSATKHYENKKPKTPLLPLSRIIRDMKPTLQCVKHGCRSATLWILLSSEPKKCAVVTVRSWSARNLGTQMDNCKCLLGSHIQEVDGKCSYL